MHNMQNKEKGNRKAKGNRKGLPLLIATLGVAGIMTALALMTYNAGRGTCPQCGYQKDRYACKHCGWTACLGCWQKYSKYTCPSCGRGNP